MGLHLFYYILMDDKVNLDDLSVEQILALIGEISQSGTNKQNLIQRIQLYISYLSNEEAFFTFNAKLLLLSYHILTYFLSF